MIERLNLEKPIIKLISCTYKPPVSIKGILVTHLEKDYNHYYS